MKSTKFWIILIGAVLALSLTAAAWQFSRSSDGRYAEVLQNGVLIRTVELSKDQEFTVTASGGAYNKIRVKDGKIAVVEASCPDKICIHQGAVSSSAKTIVCLPNKLVIKVVATDP
jgi:hypothetical protein